MAIHVVNVRYMPCDKQGAPILKESSTIKQVMDQGEHQHRIVPDIAHAPNSVNYPTIKDYLILEDGDVYKLVYMDQFTIVTQT